VIVGRWECTRCQARAETFSPREEPAGWSWRLIWSSIAGPDRFTPCRYDVLCGACDAKSPTKKLPDPPREPGPMPW
jgi:hypothetical protein